MQQRSLIEVKWAMTELEKSFGVGYYQWAKEVFRGEFNNGFPLLSKLRCSASLPIPEFISTLPDDEQWRFALALLRRGVHREAAELCGEPLSEGERELLDRYHHRTKVEHFIGTFWRIGPSKKETDIKAGLENGKLIPQKSTKSFRDAVLKRISQSLGTAKIEQSGANAMITFTTPIADWTVQTLIGFSTKVPLRYSHVLSVRSVPGFNPHVSLLGSLGIIGDTMWDLLTTDVADEAIGELVTLCTRFLSEAPKWLPRISA